MSSIELTKEIVALDAKVKEMEQVVKDLKAERANVEAMLLEAWAVEGIDQLKVDGRTVFTQSTTRANIKKNPEAFEAFAAHGAPDLIKETINANSLAAWVREREVEGSSPDDPVEKRFNIDPELARFISVHDQTHVRVRKS